MSNIEEIKKIYDTDLVCEYENEKTDTKYREEFLRVFRMEEFIEDQIIDKQQTLFENLKNEDKFVRLAKKAAKHGSIRLMDRSRSDDCEFGIIILFSFSAFATFHKCICDYVNNNGTITEEFNGYFLELLLLLQKL